MDKIYLGRKACVTRVVTDEDVRKFAEVSGDNNPIHLDEEVAAHSRFKKRIAHGMLCSSFMIAASVKEFEQYGGIHLGQELKFLRPIYIDEKITIELEVIEVDKEKGRAKIKTTCYNSQHEVAIVGVASVIPA